MTYLQILWGYRAQQALLALPDIADRAGYCGNDWEAHLWLAPTFWGAAHERDTRREQAHKNALVACQYAPADSADEEEWAAAWDRECHYCRRARALGVKAVWL